MMYVTMIMHSYFFVTKTFKLHSSFQIQIQNLFTKSQYILHIQNIDWWADQKQSTARLILFSFCSTTYDSSYSHQAPIHICLGILGLPGIPRSHTMHNWPMHRCRVGRTNLRTNDKPWNSVKDDQGPASPILSCRRKPVANICGSLLDLTLTFVEIHGS